MHAHTFQVVSPWRGSYGPPPPQPNPDRLPQPPLLRREPKRRQPAWPARIGFPALTSMTENGETPTERFVDELGKVADLLRS